MSIPLITNFTINTTAPIDSRMVASNSVARNSIPYIYDGMQIFQLDTRSTWVYNATIATWSNISVGVGNNGIYGGSGSLIGNTYVNTGAINNIVNNQSNNFILSASASASAVYYSTIFNRHTPTSDYSGVEVINQYSHDGDISNIAYIAFNPYDSNTLLGNIDFGTGNNRRMTLRNDGVLILWSPTYSANFITSGLTQSVNYILPSKSGTLAMLTDVGLPPIFYEADYIGKTSTSFDTWSTTELSTFVVCVYLTINSISPGSNINYLLAWIDYSGFSRSIFSANENTVGIFSFAPVTIRCGAFTSISFYMQVTGTINFDYGIKVIK